MRVLVFLCVVVVALGLTGCEPKPDSAVLLDDMVVYTQRDDTAKFFNHATFTMPMDEIAYYASNNGSQQQYAYKAVDDGSGIIQMMIDIVHDTLEARNYTFVAKDANPDLGVVISIIEDYYSYVQAVYTGGYGGYYYGYGYNPYTYVQQSSLQGEIMIEIIDLKNKKGNKVVDIWVAELSDFFNVLPNSQKDATRRGIIQAFEQSQYIRHVN